MTGGVLIAGLVMVVVLCPAIWVSTRIVQKVSSRFGNLPAIVATASILLLVIAGMEIYIFPHLVG